MARNTRYDAFIAYAKADAAYAKRLHQLLTAAGHRVFLDSETLIAGEPWQEKTIRAQQNSRLNLVLIADQTDSAYFEREEVFHAIELARNEGNRVVPIYLTRKSISVTRPPLAQLHGINWLEDSSVLAIAQKIEDALKASRPQQEPHPGIVADTIIIVTGCHSTPEIFDRPTAYGLQTAIDDFAKSSGRIFLSSVVMGDIWFVRDASTQNHGNVISLGSKDMNGLTGIIAGAAKAVREDTSKRWQILRQENRWALFGDRAEDTYDAVCSFKRNDLPGFLEVVWSRPYLPS
jgi:hypothetical protein